ncbi:uncharacterized protein [Apostichopus japonicus]|uniref:uncharacterized protein n=1 Tax=Stichopus japonicus TaxID=307972 RepID=UPI003AB4324E
MHLHCVTLTWSVVFLYAVGKHVILYPFLRLAFVKFKDCCMRWKSISSSYGEIAANCWSELNLINCSSPTDITRTRTSRSVGYHRECYQRFTDISKLSKAEQRRDLSSIQSDNASDIPDDKITEPPEPKKARLRSREATTSKSDRPHIFPAKCLICNADRWTRDRHSGARKREPLTKCETIEAGQLRKAADRDLVAAEAQYHKSCYKDSTRFLTKAKKDEAEKVDTTYGKAFEEFCKEYIDNQIFKKHEIYRMNKLRLHFIKMVKKVQDVDASSYRTFKLKKRLQRCYPHLQFIKPNKRNDSEIVLSRLLEAKDIAEEALTYEDGNLSLSEPSQDDTTDDESTQTNEPSKGTKLSEIYFTARKLRESIQSIEMTTPWPPGGQDLNLDKARVIIPISIYNFLAWVMGSSNDPEEERLVTVSESDDQRIVSIAQDIIYHASSGRKQMPKHLALGMTVRHMTGSAKLIGILNGFGHAVSHSAVLEHDTAIAEEQTKKGPLNLPLPP